VLVSTLGPKYRIPEIISPPRAPTKEQEATYVGLYTFIISTIYLSGGSLPEEKLNQYLRRCNADSQTPLDRTEKVIQRMINDGYLYKVKDSSSGEEATEYYVGTRGKIEVGEVGTANLVRTVYEGSADDLDKRLERTLALVPKLPEARGRKRRGGEGGEDDEEFKEES
jgi:hypothetical protein